jgi:hypothetical protein
LTAIALLDISLEFQAIEASERRASLDRHGAVPGDRLHPSGLGTGTGRSIRFHCSSLKSLENPIAALDERT